MICAPAADAASMKRAREAEAPEQFATLAHAAVSIPLCYAGGGTEIFTEGRSSIRWWKASSFG